MVVDGMQPMQQAVADSIAQQRFAMMLFAIFAGVALLLGRHRHLRRAVLHCGTAHARGRHPHGAGRAERRCGMGGPARRSRMTLPGVGIGLVVALGLTRLDVGLAVWREADRRNHLCVSRVAAVRGCAAGVLRAGATRGKARPHAGAGRSRTVPVNFSAVS
jgi:hypothetical protein